MVICVCHRVSDKDIKQAVREGASNMKALRQHCKVASTCGRCAGWARGVLSEAQNTADIGIHTS